MLGFISLNLRLFLVLLLGFILIGCKTSERREGHEVVDVQKTSEAQELSGLQKQKSIETLLNSGLQEHVVATNEVIIINADEKLIKWRLSLGRNDFKLANFEIFNNKAQKSLRLTKVGRYQVTLESVINRGQVPAMRHQLIIVVE